jgi:hypothetical protein
VEVCPTGLLLVESWKTEAANPLTTGQSNAQWSYVGRLLARSRRVRSDSMLGTLDCGARQIGRRLTGSGGTVPSSVTAGRE